MAQQTNTRILHTINSPSDVKALSKEDLETLAGEIRQQIIEVTSEHGGHLASNLGAVELTLALHCAFDSPKDKIIWDVGHQCYTHKLVTGRKDAFSTIRQKDGLSGFPKQDESEHDIFGTGHASTSISAALGILTGEQLQGIGGKVVAVIGDGALSSGLALEALNHAGHLKKNLIILVNDNNMSISPNVGALSSYLSRLTATHIYQDFRDKIDGFIQRIPLLGKTLYSLIVQVKKGIKAFFFKENIFSDLGFEYVGPIDGHNIAMMRQVLATVKKLNKPVVVHIHTVKGKGYNFAEGDPSKYHGVSPFSIVNGKQENIPAKSYTDVFSEALVSIARTDRRVAAITAAMAKGTGLSAFQDEFPERFFDAGITEPHAVTFAAGLAVSGMRPVTAIYSTFIQRSVDQIIHDVALQRLPVTIALDRAGLVANDGATHQGIFDIPLLRGVPGLTICAPASAEEMHLMLAYAVRADGPVVLRYPKAACPNIPALGEETLVPGKGCFLKKTGAETLIVTAGSLITEAVKAAKQLLTSEIRTDVYNLRFIRPLDIGELDKIFSSYRLVCCFEDGARAGGIGEYIASRIAADSRKYQFRYYGVPDQFPEHASRDELLAMYGLNGTRIAETMKETIEQEQQLRLFNPRAALS